MSITFDHPLAAVPWIESPFFETLLAQTDFNETETEAARFFHHNGFLVTRIDIPDFDAMVGRITSDLAGRYGSSPRIQDAWEYQDDVRRIAGHEPVLDILRRFYRREPVPFQTLNFHRGSEQALHSDAPHFSSIPERFMVGVWVALEDIDADNGALQYVPGSHRLPIYTNEHLGVVGSEDKERYERGRYRTLWEGLADACGLETQVFSVPKGTALIWAANLLHGGLPHRDRTRSRHSMVTHYFFEDCVYYTPFLSDPAFGRIAYRSIRDIRTGAMVPNRYAGRPVPESVVEAFHPFHGVNAIGREPAKPGQPLLSAGRAFRTENVPDGGFSHEGGRILLHPNPGGAPSARLIIAGLDVSHGARLSTKVAVMNTESAPVRFTVEAVLADGGTSVWHKQVLAGLEEAWVVEIDAHPGPIDLVLSTTMVGEGTSNAYAWAHWLSPALQWAAS